MVTHLVIPDSHAHPDYNNNRYTWLGNFILDLKPDVIIDLGDSADMPSLCSYDKGTKGFEGRRYKKDLESYYDAQDKLWNAVNNYNTRRVRNKSKQYKPRKIKLIGNHEYRIVRATNLEPMLEGTIGLGDLKDKSFGYSEVYPFLHKVIVDGICYSHYFVSGVMGRPVSGVNPARTLLNKGHMSCTQGHTHTYAHAVDTCFDGRDIQGLVAGCYFDYDPEFATASSDLYRRGVVVKRNVKNGNYDLEWISLESLKHDYS